MFVKVSNYASVRLVLILMLVAGFLDIIPAQGSSVIRYVKWNANGTNNGTS